MRKRSKLDIAYEIIDKAGHEIPFFELWDQVAVVLEYSNDEKTNLISGFYTSLLLDNRFVNLGDNTWHLRKENTYDKVHIDIGDIYTADDEVDEDLEELEAQRKEASSLLDVDEEAEIDFDVDDL